MTLRFGFISPKPPLATLLADDWRRLALARLGDGSGGGGALPSVHWDHPLSRVRYICDALDDGTGEP